MTIIWISALIFVFFVGITLGRFLTPFVDGHIFENLEAETEELRDEIDDLKRMLRKANIEIKNQKHSAQFRRVELQQKAIYKLEKVRDILATQNSLYTYPQVMNRLSPIEHISEIIKKAEQLPPGDSVPVRSFSLNHIEEGLDNKLRKELVKLCEENGKLYRVRDELVRIVSGETGINKKEVLESVESDLK